MHILLYTTPTCPYCKLVKDFLKDKGATYTEVDVANDAEAANEMVKKSGQMGVPVLEINGEVIVGWNQAAIGELLDKSNDKKKEKSLA